MSNLEMIFIPLFVSLVFIYNAHSNPFSKRNNAFLFFAFLFVCLGDYIINLTQWGAWFIIPFVLVHVNLILYFSKEKPWTKSDIKFVWPIMLLSALLYFILIPIIADTTRLLVLAIYMALLSTMLWRAICYTTTKNNDPQKIRIIAGAFLFYVTDLSVASNVVIQSKVLIVVTWICYVPALVMLSLMNYSFKK